MSDTRAVTRFRFGTASTQLGGELGGIELIHTRFTRSLRRAFLPLIRYQPEVTRGPIEHRAYDAYVSGRAGRAVCFNIIRAEPLRGNLLVSVPPALVSALVDGFFGGRARGTSGGGARELTPTEERVIGRLVDGVCAGLTRAWEDVARLRFTPVGTETNAQLAIVLENDDAVVLCPFDVMLEGADEPHTIEILYPVAMLKPVLPGLRSATGGERPATAEGEWTRRLLGALADVPIPVRARVAEPGLPLSRLLALAPGDIIAVRAEPHVRLMAGGVVVAEGVLGDVGGTAAVRVARLLAAPPRAEAEPPPAAVPAEPARAAA